MRNYKFVSSLLVILLVGALASCSNSKTSSTTKETSTSTSQQTNASRGPVPPPAPASEETAVKPPSETPATSSNTDSAKSSQTPTPPADTATPQPVPAKPTADRVYGPEVGKYAPLFEVVTLAGHKIALEDYLGKTVILKFWASWCGKCKATAPELKKFYDAHSDDVVVIAVNLWRSDTMDGVQKYVEQYEINYPVVIDLTGAVINQYRVAHTSTYYIIDPQGVIRDIFSYQILTAKDFEAAYQKITKTAP